MPIDELTLHWLAGLLEGEGSFRAGIPSKPGKPRIALQMKDEDIVAKVASIFGMSYQKVDTKRAEENGWSQTYFTATNAGKAYQWMEALYPLMGQRRKAQIDKALNSYIENRCRILTPQKIEEIRDRALKGESPFWLAKEYGISKSLAYYIKDGYTYKNQCGCSSAVEHLPSKQGVTDSNSVTRLLITTQNNSKIEPESLSWLAGILEAEGSFLAPPPSSPNTPRISIAMIDEDVIAHVAELFGRKYQFWQRKKANCKPVYMVSLKGRAAVDLMRDLRPLMGQRRQAQIDYALYERKHRRVNE